MVQTATDPAASSAANAVATSKTPSSANSSRSASTAASSVDQPAGGDAVIIVGGGLAGLAAAYEITRGGRKVIIVDQEPEQNLGGQAWWSLGGLFLIDTPEQRRLGIKDTYELARRDWFNSAQFDKIDTEDKWAVQWAEEYLKFAAGPMREYLSKLGIKLTFNVGWAERGSGDASGHGNSVPRFHVAWGTGTDIVRVFRDPVLAAAKDGLVEFKFRHRVDELLLEDGKCVGVKGVVLEPSDVERGAQSSRKIVGDFQLKGRAVVVSSGGIGGSPDLIREMWPQDKLGKCPQNMVLGVPHHVDGRMLKISQHAGARAVNAGRFWFYTEGMKNWNPIWPNHGIRVIPGPSSLWLDATGKRLPAPLFPGCDTIATFKHILKTGYDYTWFVLDQTIIQKEFALSGSEQNPDLTGKSLLMLLSRVLRGAEPVKKFMQHGEDFVVRDTLDELVVGMNELATKSGRGPSEPIKYEDVLKIVQDRDEQVPNGYSKDAQMMLINNARSYWAERIGRVAKPHRILDPAHKPLIAVRMNLISRKTLGGLQTNLDAQVLREDGETPIEGLYAAGEVAGFGGGGVMGYNALEGSFLTGCIFSGRAAGLALAKA
ncbi:putative FAD-dependent oxidoreductase [Tilletiaria anomala UBC 951]|uniref:Putative FAD-dependent oxidoreductase n=1 Tax=Tilletiaria anomala (strain ATCC 24038 / CBS 436.72 / UBC 951) TaxID=1037660 RepID=A0A066W0U9_TILAU|nr:putative FAD-dependent oxidoreductase [Tilletiaria anomala UBC 951]KDN44699.1 putative FAD-dependent oxidoreductase [Tilletiaria anomala UBC 951]